MRCHFIKVKGIGKVLIPGCMAVTISNDITACTCPDILTEAKFERKRYNEVVDGMKREIAELREENEILRKGYIKIISNENEKEIQSHSPCTILRGYPVHL